MDDALAISLGFLLIVVVLIVAVLFLERRW